MLPLFRRSGWRFRADFRKFRKLSGAAGRRLPLRWKDRFPCLDDRTPATAFDRHYVFHTAWAARVLAETRPRLHVDISSSLYFCSIVSAFVPMRFYDYRPAELGLGGLETGAADLLALPFPDGSLSSLSCMHVVEHVGLGRYGDPLDPEGDLRAIRELVRVTGPGGDLLLVVPVGEPRVAFNAHRIFAAEQVLEAAGGMELREFALVPDRAGDGGLLRQASLDLAARQRYGCGCYWFRKVPA